MKIKLLGLTLFTLLIAVSCKKKDNSEPEKEAQLEKVTIGGKAYEIVKIGDQHWINTNYSGEGGIWNDATTSKPEYGKFYTYEEVQQFTLPAGWRVPTEADYRKLLTTIGVSFVGAQIQNAEKLKALTSKTNWNNISGTNTSGFNAYPGGYSIDNAYPIGGANAEFWTSSDRTFSIMESGNNTTYNVSFYGKTNQPDRFNVRFVKDAQ
ncbi:FISUMP domain-containing protein [Desertivirga arenae]|uniref:FISUMP domain-containing protein n=1 Tax=Desertivirga arenae TaxID=2810309 RepID=UPI001A976800|nr:FISUMP domain-containing protein [Pedobacter sp. SYSU D00823]